MEVVVDASGHPAPRLIDAQVARHEASALYADLRGQVVRMLGCDLVHGDLSPYNVLLGWNGPVIIDFPQVVGAAHNSQAESFLRRDLENLRRHFAALDPALHASAGDVREIWRAYVRRELTPEFVPSGRSAEPTRGHRASPRLQQAPAESTQLRSHRMPPESAQPRPPASPPQGAPRDAAHAGSAHVPRRRRRRRRSSQRKVTAP
jgi:RIO kinase 1